MPFLTASAARRAVTVLMIVLAICGTALTLDAKPAGAAASSDRLVLTWAEDGNRLQVTGVGYRARDLVEVRLGSRQFREAVTDFGLGYTEKVEKNVTVQAYDGST
ncbi:hypothetical protein AB0C31_08120, partial [Actinoplanes philippinensis]